MDEEATMKVLIVPLLAIFVGACATMQAGRSEVSILVDLDPASTDRTVIVESITADREGRLYLPDRVSGNVQEVAKNGSAGPLEFPSAIVFVGNTAYISNYDTPRRDNMDANGQTARDGIGASIAQITP
jgi:hypothetical protein